MSFIGDRYEADLDASVIMPKPMEPYYDEDGITIYWDDCRAILPRINADVVVTDPPYGVGVEYEDFDDSQENLTGLIAGVWPLLERFPVVAMTPGNRNIYRWPEPDGMLCWHVPAGSGVNKWGFTTWHAVLVYGKDPYSANGLGSRADSISMQATRADVGSGAHPCAKPPKFMEWLVNRVSVKATDVILDPFMGSGSTLVAAKKLGHRAVGIELSEEYCELAVRRLAQGVLNFTD